MTDQIHHHLHPSDVVEYAYAITRGDDAEAWAIVRRGAWQYQDHVLAPLRMAVAMVGATCPVEGAVHMLALRATPGAENESMRGFEQVFDAVLQGRYDHARELVDAATPYHAAEWCLVSSASLIATYTGGGFRPTERVEVPDTIPDEWTTDTL